MRDQQPHPFPAILPGQPGWREGAWRNFEILEHVDEYERTWDWRFHTFARHGEWTGHRNALEAPYRLVFRPIMIGMIGKMAFSRN